MFKNKKLLIYLLIPVFVLVLSACTTQTKQYIHSDGSVLIKQEVDIYEYFKATMENQLSGDEGEGELTLEESALISSISQAQEICKQHQEQEYDDFEPEDVFSVCETTDDGKVIYYTILAPNYINSTLSEEFQEYSLVEILGESYSEGIGASSDSTITLYFDNEIIYSDIGTISQNQVLINLLDWAETENEEGLVIRVKNEDKPDNNKKTIATLSVELSKNPINNELTYLIHRTTSQQELSPYFHSIEQSWDLNSLDLQMKICPQYSSEESRLNVYIPNIYSINCDLESNLIGVETQGKGLGGLMFFDEFENYYSFNLIRLISMSLSPYDEESFKEIILPDYANNSEINLIFDYEIISTDLGKKESNRLILTWEDLQNIKIDSTVSIAKNELIKGDALSKYSIVDQKIYNSLKGKILLQVEANGEAYYIHPEKLEMFSLGRPDDAFAVMREQGIGISNDNLLKIPTADTNALKNTFEGVDSDGDGYDDYTELMNNYNPYGAGRINYDLNFASKNAGKIFLQVEANGEAWYVNGEDNKRYFLGRPNDAFEIMRTLGLGISNENLNKLAQIESNNNCCCADYFPPSFSVSCRAVDNFLDFHNYTLNDSQLELEKNTDSQREEYSIYLNSVNSRTNIASIINDNSVYVLRSYNNYEKIEKENLNTNNYLDSLNSLCQRDLRPVIDFYQDNYADNSEIIISSFDDLIDDSYKHSYQGDNIISLDTWTLYSSKAGVYECGQWVREL